MSYARAIFLGLAVAGGCAGETFDLLPLAETEAGDGGEAGNPPTAGSAGNRGGRGGMGGTGGFASSEGGDAGAGECKPETAFDCNDHDDCCSEYAPMCLVSKRYCVACLVDDDRCDFGLKCDPLTNSCMTACREETVTSDCSVSRPRCDTGRGVCVECVFNSDCTRPGATRCPWTGNCEECVDNQDCAQFPSRPICHQFVAGAQAFTCRGCWKNSECKAGYRCEYGACVAQNNQSEP